MTEDLCKLLEDGYRRMGHVMLQIRMLSSRSNGPVDEVTQRFIYRLSDAMHNVPQALETIHAHGDSQAWAVPMLKRSIAEAAQVWADYNRYLAEGD